MEPIAVSKQISSQLSELIATGLSNASYVVEMTFGEYESLTCVHG